MVGIYDTQGNLKVRYIYDAWGNCTIDSEATTDTALAKANPIRYRGYYYDTDIGLYYLNARYYSPQLRRFISPDDTAYLDPETVDGLNLYAYCCNDPVNYADPSGHSAFLIAMSILAVAGLIATGIGVATDNNFITAIGLTAVAIPALITGGIAISLLTPVGVGIGIATAVAGVGTGLFASAEYQESFAGNNWIMDATGMSNGLYNTLLLSTAAIATLGTMFSSVAYAFRMNTITKVGKITGSDYKGIKFTQQRNGGIVHRSLEFHHGHAHKGYKLHWQLNKWSKTGSKLREGTAWWTIWLKRI